MRHNGEERGWGGWILYMNTSARRDAVKTRQRTWMVKLKSWLRLKSCSVTPEDAPFNLSARRRSYKLRIAPRLFIVKSCNSTVVLITLHRWAVSQLSCVQNAETQKNSSMKTPICNLSVCVLCLCLCVSFLASIYVKTVMIAASESRVSEWGYLLHVSSYWKTINSVDVLLCLRWVHSGLLYVMEIFASVLPVLKDTKGVWFMYEWIFNTNSTKWSGCTESPSSLTEAVAFSCGVPLTGDWECYCRLSCDSQCLTSLLKAY